MKKAYILLALTTLGMGGIYLQIEYSGWVLFLACIGWTNL